MRSSEKTLRLVLGLALCGFVMAASDIGGSSPAAAFSLGFGFGHGGGFEGPSKGLGAGPRTMAPGRGGGRMVDRPSGLGREGAGFTGGRDRGISGSPGGIVGRGVDTGGGGPRIGGNPGVVVGRGVDTGGGGPRTNGSPGVVVGPGGAVAGGGGGGAAAVGGGGGNNGSGVPPRGERRYVADEIITAFSPSVTPEAIDQLARRHNLTRLESQSFALTGTTLYRWRLSGRRSVADEVGTIEDERIVARAQPNYIFSLQEDAAKKPTNTSGDSAQYVLAKLQIEQAQQLATGKNIAVVLIDSAIDTKHPDLDAAIVKSFDALGGGETPHSHGTAMAGAIAAHGKLMGIAPGAQLLAARAFGDASGTAEGTSYAIYKGLQWAADNNARVVNMSFAGPADPTLHSFLAAAYDKGIVLIAAAGNAGPNSAPLYPAADPNVIAVTATDRNDGVFKMANRGPYIALAAPGVEILALAPADAYQITTGTSVATAHVSGVVALLLERQPTLKPAEVRAILMATAQPLGSAAQRSDFGAGLANAYRAVTSPTAAPLAKARGEEAKQ